jgi:hypothetical protein
MARAVLGLPACHQSWNTNRALDIGFLDDSCPLLGFCMAKFSKLFRRACPATADGARRLEEKMNELLI